MPTAIIQRRGKSGMTTTIHYRVWSATGRIMAYGCGHAGVASSTRTADAKLVTCGACKRSREWRAAMATPLPGGGKKP